MTALHQLLRTETKDLHERLEQLRFFQEIRAGSLPKLPIVTFLRCLTIIHAVLEGQLAEIEDLDIARLAGLAIPKIPLLLADLKLLGSDLMPGVNQAIYEAIRFGDRILTDAIDPLSLVGIIYVLEGSQNGGDALKQGYADCLGLRREQISYFGCYGAATASHWKSIGKSLDSLRLDHGKTETVVHSAVQCFEHLEKICGALYPYSDSDVQHQISAVNFEARDHAMPQNPLEISLALRAGKEAWNRFPYLELRFGDRGKRFTSSDSCWLLALTRLPVEVVTRRLEWLRTVLASRGIPTVILEGHLSAIVVLLATEFPHEIEVRTRFDQFLLKLDIERQMLGGVAKLNEIIGKFDKRLHVCSGLHVKSAARLVASAWVDECSGIIGAFPAVFDWFTDGDRFSRDWIIEISYLTAALKEPWISPC